MLYSSQLLQNTEKYLGWHGSKSATEAQKQVLKSTNRKVNNNENRIFNFEQITQPVLVFLLLTLNMYKYRLRYRKLVSKKLTCT